MINRLEIHNTWNDVVPAWKMVWQDCHDLERWAAFMLQCDRLLALAKEEGLTELEDALRPLTVLLAYVKEPGTSEIRG